MKDVLHQTLNKKSSFPLRISSANVTKSEVSFEFGHICWRNPSWKFLFFMQWKLKPEKLKLSYCSRSSRTYVVCKKGVLNIFTKFARKHLCHSLFLKKETLAHVFSYEFCEIFKKTLFYKNTSGGRFCISLLTQSFLHCRATLLKLNVLNSEHYCQWLFLSSVY